MSRQNGGGGGSARRGEAHKGFPELVRDPPPPPPLLAGMARRTSFCLALQCRRPRRLSVAAGTASRWVPREEGSVPSTTAYHRAPSLSPLPSHSPSLPPPTPSQPPPLLAQTNKNTRGCCRCFHGAVWFSDGSRSSNDLICPTERARARVTCPCSGWRSRWIIAEWSGVFGCRRGADRAWGAEGWGGGAGGEMGGCWLDHTRDESGVG